MTVYGELSGLLMKAAQKDAQDRRIGFKAEALALDYMDDGINEVDAWEKAWKTAEESLK